MSATEPREPREPRRERSLTGDSSAKTAWKTVLERLENPESPRTCWVATTRPSGGPHLAPVISFWMDGAMHVLAGEGTRKAQNIAADGRCVIGMTSTTLPSIDIMVEGVAAPVTDEAEVRGIAELLRANNWPLEVEGTRLNGPHAPTAGPPPYTIYRIVPETVFGLPGMVGMDQFDPSELPKPTRWDFD